MKLLFDENLSPNLPRLVRTDFPGSEHVREIGLKGRTDEDIWNYARVNGFTLISKDRDFFQRAALRRAAQIHLATAGQLHSRRSIGPDSAPPGGHHRVRRFEGIRADSLVRSTTNGHQWTRMGTGWHGPRFPRPAAGT